MYVVIEHRNHMGVMSATRIEMDAKGELMADFRNKDGYTGVPM